MSLEQPTKKTVDNVIDECEIKLLARDQEIRDLIQRGLDGDFVNAELREFQKKEEKARDTFQTESSELDFQGKISELGNLISYFSELNTNASVDLKGTLEDTISGESQEAVGRVLLDARGAYSREKDDSITVNLTQLFKGKFTGDYWFLDNNSELHKEAEIIMHEILTFSKSTEEIIGNVNKLLSSIAKLFFLDPETVVPRVKIELKTYDLEDNSNSGEGMYITIDEFNIAKTIIDEEGKIAGKFEVSNENFFAFLQQFVKKVKNIANKTPIGEVDWKDAEVTVEESETDLDRNFLDQMS